MNFSLPGSPKLDFVFTVCEQRGEGGLPNLAGTADDRPLGRSRPSGGFTERSGSRTGVSRGIFLFWSAESVYALSPLKTLDSLALKRENSTTSARPWPLTHE